MRSLNDLDEKLLWMLSAIESGEGWGTIVIAGYSTEEINSSLRDLGAGLVEIGDVLGGTSERAGCITHRGLTKLGRSIYQDLERLAKDRKKIGRPVSWPPSR